MKYLAAFFILALSYFPSIAQDSTIQVIPKQITDQKIEKHLAVSEEVRFMSKGEKNAFLVSIENTSMKMVTKVWEKYMKDFKGKTKMDKKTKEYFSDNSKLAEISANTVDIYARFGETGGSKIDCYVWYDLGGNYLNSKDNPEKAQSASNMLGEFARLVAKEEAKELLDAEEKVLKALEQDLKKLEKEQESFLKKIEDANELIAKMRSNLELNANSQSMKRDEIKSQGKQVDLAKDKVQSFN
jgi:vacuolar-type H+-ATPase subunit I/STV1